MCEQAYDSIATSNEGGIRGGGKRHKREELTPTATIDENAIAAHINVRK